MVASHAEVAIRSIPGGAEAAPSFTMQYADLYYAPGAQWVLPTRVGGATSQLDLPSLTPVSVDDCGPLQLGVPYWATSVITASS